MNTQTSTDAQPRERLDERRRMVEEQIVARGISNPLVIEAMLWVRRHEFIPPSHQDLAYADHPVPIGNGQTISQPYIVAQMTDLACLEPRDKVLDIGTGSGYQAAILAQMGVRTFSMEIVKELAERAEAILRSSGYSVRVRVGDGSIGWPAEAPFDAIIIAAAAPLLPKTLLEQLKVGGKLIVPIGDSEQDLYVMTRTPQGFEQVAIEPVRFVPMTGSIQDGITLRSDDV